VAIDTNHLLPQHTATFASPHATIEFRSLLVWRDTSVKTVLRRIVEIASSGTTL